MKSFATPHTVTRPKAPDVGDSLSRRLASMERQLLTIARTGGGLGPCEVESLSRDVSALARSARGLETEGSGSVYVNPAVPEAFELLFKAEDALGGTRAALRERLHDKDVDPTGAIRASIQVSANYAAQAEALIAGGRLQS